MTVNEYSDLNETHRDVLRELGNIGTGSALTSLSQMTSQPIKMDVPQIRIVEFQELPQLFDSATKSNAGVVITVHGDLECVVLFILNDAFLHILAEELTGEPLQDILSMTDMQKSAICEIGNIMCNSYLNALAAMLEADLSVSIPQLKTGTSAQVLQAFSADFKDEKAEILFIENTFSYQNQEFSSYILLHPKFESLKKILQKLEW